jgi:hypothetical protein
LAATNIRELRVLVQHKGTMLRLCKLMFTSGDASIYLVPYASAGHYFLGGHEFAEQERQATFDFTKQLSSKLKQLPKLSLHETGQVHVQVGRDRAGPLRIPPLSELRGQHVASISADGFEALARFEGTPRSSGAEQDFVFVVEPGLDSGRIALYVNGEEPSFGDDCPVRIALTRPTLASPLHLGLRPWGQLPLD